MKLEARTCNDTSETLGNQDNSSGFGKIDQIDRIARHNKNKGFFFKNELNLNREF